MHYAHFTFWGENANISISLAISRSCSHILMARFIFRVLEVVVMSVRDELMPQDSGVIDVDFSVLPMKPIS